MIHNHCVIQTHTIIVCTNKRTQVYKLISICLQAFLELLLYICSQKLYIYYRSYVQRMNKNILSIYFTVHSHTQPKQIFNFHLSNKIQLNISHLFQGLSVKTLTNRCGISPFTKCIINTRKNYNRFFKRCTKMKKFEG